MPTDLPIRCVASPRSTPAGNLFLAGAVLAMLVISTLLVLFQPGVLQPS